MLSDLGEESENMTGRTRSGGATSTKRRGRPRGSKNSRPSTQIETFNVSRSSSTRSSQRYRSYTSLAESESNESDDGDEGEENGIRIEEVCAGPPLGNGQAYLCKMPNTSYLNLLAVEKNQLSQGSHSSNVLGKYTKRVNRGYEIVSNINQNFSVPASNPIPPTSYFVDRIITHRCDEEAVHVIPQVMDPSHYLPGLPIDGKEELDFISFHQNPLRHVDEQAELFMGDDGSLILDRNYVLPTPTQAQNASKEADGIKGPPPKTKFLIKWVGLSDQYATWETEESLLDKDICIGNREEFKVMLADYWSRFGNEITKEITLVNNVAKLENNIKLSEGQIEAINNIITAYNKKMNSNVYGEKGSGRVMTMAALLYTLKQTKKKPSIVIADSGDIVGWQQTLRLATNLRYVSFMAGSSRERDLTRQYEFSGENGAKFDVLIIDHHVIGAELQMLRNVKWGVAIVDSRSFRCDYELSEFLEAPHVTLVPTSEDSSIIIDQPPFSYTEHVIMEKDTNASLTRAFFNDTLKLKPSRQTVEIVAVDMFNVLLRELTHPSLALQFNTHVNQQYRVNSEITSGRNLTAADHINMIGMFGVKMGRLLSLAQQGGDSVVVAEDFPAIRLIASFLQNKGVSCVVCQSNERAVEPRRGPKNTVYLTTRWIFSPLLMDLNPARVIFFDLPECIETDRNIAQFFLRLDPKPEIVRLLIYDSLDTLLFSLFLKGFGLNLTKLSSTDCELLIRAVAMMTKVARKKPEYKSDFTYEYPSECDEISAMVDQVYDSVRMDNDFWEEIYPSPTGQRLKQSLWGAIETVNLIDAIGRYGYGEWETLQKKFDRPLEELQPFARACMLQHLVHIEDTDYSKYALACALLQLDYFGEPYPENAASGRKYWSEVSERDPDFCTTIFISKSVAKLLTSSPTRLLNNVQRVHIILAYLSVHPEPELPPRCIVPTSFQRLTPALIYEVLNAALENGFGIQACQEIVKEITPEEYDYIHHTVVPMMQQDVYARAALYDVADPSNKYIRAIALAIKSPPYTFEWPEPVVMEIVKQIGEFGVPRRDGVEQFTTLAGFAGVVSKSPSAISDFVDSLRALIVACASASNPVIIPESLTHVKPVVKMIRNKEKVVEMSVSSQVALETKAAVDYLARIREALDSGFTEMKPQAFLPPGWTVECDHALLQGVVQYGLKNIGQLASIPFKKPQEGSPDHMMCRPLDEFAEFITEANCRRRIQFLIFNYTLINRRLTFFDGTIRKLIILNTETQRMVNELKRLHAEYDALKSQEEKVAFMQEHPELETYIVKEAEKARRKRNSNRLSPPRKLGSKNDEQTGRGFSPPPAPKKKARTSAKKAEDKIQPTEGGAEAPPKPVIRTIFVDASLLPDSDVETTEDDTGFSTHGKKPKSKPKPKQKQPKKTHRDYLKEMQQQVQRPFPQ